MATCSWVYDWPIQRCWTYNKVLELQIVLIEFVFLELFAGLFLLNQLIKFGFDTFPPPVAFFSIVCWCSDSTINRTPDFLIEFSCTLFLSGTRKVNSSISCLFLCSRIQDHLDQADHLHDFSRFVLEFETSRLEHWHLDVNQWHKSTYPLSAIMATSTWPFHMNVVFGTIKRRWSIEDMAIRCKQ